MYVCMYVCMYIHLFVTVSAWCEFDKNSVFFSSFAVAAKNHTQSNRTRNKENKENYVPFR